MAEPEPEANQLPTVVRFILFLSVVNMFLALPRFLLTVDFAVRATVKYWLRLFGLVRDLPPTEQHAVAEMHGT